MSLRERRLLVEFQKMLAIQKEHGLIRFTCGDMTGEEAKSYLEPSFSAAVVLDGMRKLLPPEDFARQHPNRGPEKYLVQFDCVGLQRLDSGAIEETRDHFLEVVFAYDYPAVPPRYVWLTPIWHPNIEPPYLCTTGRPFAVGTTLDQVCLMVGHMIQYKIFNIASYLNRDAALWAEKNRSRFPIDGRDLLGGSAHARPLAMFGMRDESVAAEAEPAGAASPFVELL